MASYIGQFPYALNTNRFLACKEKNDDTEFNIIGIPYDGAVTNRPGARFGPQAIRQASLMLCDGIHPIFDNSPNDLICDSLDMMLPNATSCEEVRKYIQKETYNHLTSNKSSNSNTTLPHQHCVFLGGDHSITYAILKAYKSLDCYKNNDIAMIHFDAHCDAWTDHFGEPSGK